MKKIFFTTIILMSALLLKAQTPELSLYDDEYGAVNGAYYKDTYNDLDNYVGTWKFTQGNTSLTIVLEERSMMPFVSGDIQFYEDVLIGEYQYIENGVEKINTLSQLPLNIPTSQHNIVGNGIIPPHSIYCKDCGPNDRKLLLMFSDPDRDIFGMEPEMIFQRVDENGIEKLKLKFRTTSTYIKLNGEEPQYTSYTIPFGEYVLVKQP